MVNNLVLGDIGAVVRAVEEPEFLPISISQYKSLV